MPRQEDVITGYFVRHKPTGKEIRQYKRLNLFVLSVLKCSKDIVPFCET